jgi:hypothetical protein
VLERTDDGDPARGCGAFVTRRGWFRKLEIPSLPAVSAQSQFWGALHEFCRLARITKVELATFGSPEGVEIPQFGGCVRRERYEFILDLEGDLHAKLTNRHRANVRRAREAGLVVRRTRAVDAVQAHQALISHSLGRRHARGEDVPSVDSSLEPVALLQTGAGDLYQALRGDAVLSSALVLRAPEGAYGHSTGTSPEGMKLGASHFLIHSIALELQADGIPALNFGAAEHGSGLARFKRDFGTRTVRLPSATCYVGPLWRRAAYRTLELGRVRQRAWQRALRHRRSRTTAGE